MVVVDGVGGGVVGQEVEVVVKVVEGVGVGVDWSLLVVLVGVVVGVVGDVEVVVVVVGEAVVKVVMVGGGSWGGSGSCSFGGTTRTKSVGNECSSSGGDIAKHPHTRIVAYLGRS